VPGTLDQARVKLLASAVSDLPKAR